MEQAEQNGRRARSRVAPGPAICSGERLIRFDQGLVQEMLLGAALVPPLTTKPKLVEALAPMEALYGAFRTVTAPVEPVFTPFQTLTRFWPLGIVSRTVHPLRLVEPLLA